MSTAAFVSFTPTKNYNKFSALVFPAYTVTTYNTAGNVTLTGAQVLGGLLLRDNNGGDRTDTLPTAALLVAACSEGLSVGNGFRFTVRNTGANTTTIAAGTGGTASGTMTIATANSKEFLVIFTNITAGSEAYTVYSLGTVTF